MQINFIDLVYLVGIVWLLLLITGALIGFFLTKGNGKDLQKYIGSFTVGLISLYARDPWVFGVAVIIAGLIIASERFMSLLASLLKSDNKFLTSENFIKMIERMSGEEVEEKNAAEIKEIKMVEHTDIDKKKAIETKKISQKERRGYFENIQHFENLMLDEYQNQVGLEMNRNVKFNNLALDAIALDKEKNQIHLIEVKVFPRTYERYGELMATLIEERLRIAIPHLILKITNAINNAEFGVESHFVLSVLVGVDTKKNLENVIERVNAIRNEYGYSNPRLSLQFHCYNIPNLEGKE